MTEYFLLKLPSPATLTEEVNSLLKDGWELFGHPFAASNHGTQAFCQAMTRRVPEEATDNNLER